MKNLFYKEGYFISRKTYKHQKWILAFLTLLSLFCLFIVYYIKNPKIVYLVKEKRVIQIKFRDIPEKDSLILIKLIPELKKREGLSFKPYNDKKCRWYIGYGHKINIYNTLISDITLIQADSILWADIRQAYFENERIKQITLKKDVKQIFISGHK